MLCVPRCIPNIIRQLFLFFLFLFFFSCPITHSCLNRACSFADLIIVGRPSHLNVNQCGATLPLVPYTGEATFPPYPPIITLYFVDRQASGAPRIFPGACNIWTDKGIPGLVFGLGIVRPGFRVSLRGPVDPRARADHAWPGRVAQGPPQPYPRLL